MVVKRRGPAQRVTDREETRHANFSDRDIEAGVSGSQPQVSRHQHRHREPFLYLEYGAVTER